MSIKWSTNWLHQDDVVAALLMTATWKHKQTALRLLACFDSEMSELWLVHRNKSLHHIFQLF